MKKGDLFPRCLINLYHRICCSNMLYYYNDYDSWEEASKAASSYGKAYESEVIIKRVSEATEVVRQGRAAFEQDGVLFDEYHYEYELLSCFFYILICEKSLSVCDFGGSLGSTFYRYKGVLPEQQVEWSIVEQKHFVDYGKRNIPEISFDYTLAECIGNHHINVVLLHSVLPYISDPYELLRDITSSGVEYIIIDETVFNVDDSGKESIVLQHVPKRIYEAVYPSHIFDKKKMLAAIEDAGYRKVFDWIYPGGAIPTRTTFGFKDNIDRGFLFQKKH